MIRPASPSSGLHQNVALVWTHTPIITLIRIFLKVCITYPHLLWLQFILLKAWFFIGVSFKNKTKLTLAREGMDTINKVSYCSLIIMFSSRSREFRTVTCSLSFWYCNLIMYILGWESINPMYPFFPTVHQCCTAFAMHGCWGHRMQAQTDIMIDKDKLVLERQLAADPWQ